MQTRNYYKRNLNDRLKSPEVKLIFFLVAILTLNDREFVLGFCIHPTIDSSPLSPSETI